MEHFIPEQAKVTHQCLGEVRDGLSALCPRCGYGGFGLVETESFRDLGVTRTLWAASPEGEVEISVGMSIADACQWALESARMLNHEKMWFVFNGTRVDFARAESLSALLIRYESLRQQAQNYDSAVSGLGNFRAMAARDFESAMDLVVRSVVDLTVERCRLALARAFACLQAGDEISREWINTAIESGRRDAIMLGSKKEKNGDKET